MPAETPAPVRARWKRVVWSVVGVAVVLYVVVIAVVVDLEGKLILPAPKVIPATTPAVAGLPFEDLHISVDAGSQIHAWWVPAASPTAKVLVYFHGNGIVLEDEADREARLFHETGANLLLVEYRGYGYSSVLSANAATTAEDARTAMRYLEQVRHVRLADVTICGWSIGTGVATQLALETPRAGGLVLFSPITSVMDVANESWLYRDLLRPAELFAGANAFANKDKIGAIHMPVLLVVGNVDPTAPPWMAQELYARANAPKTLKIVDGANHDNIFDVGGAGIVTAMGPVVAGRSK